jgi:methyl-accepting chemotaxis protein
MYKQTKSPSPPVSEAKARARDTRARRKFGWTLVVMLSALTLTMMMRGIVLRLATPAAIKGDTVAAILVAPVLMAIFWKFTGGRFARCQSAVRSDDPRVREAAIGSALRLPLYSMRVFIVCCVLGAVPIVWVGSLVSGDVMESVSAVTTDVIPFLIAMTVAIFTVTEAHSRPMLRRLYNEGGVEVERKLPYRLGIPLRVSVIIAVTVISVTLMLGGDVISDAIGAGGAGRSEAMVFVLQIPVLALVVASITWAITSSLSGTIKELSRQIDAVAGRDLSRRGAVTSTDELGELTIGVDRMTRAHADLIRSSREVASELTLSAAQVADGSEQSARGVGDIAHSMQEVVSGAQVQFDQVEAARAAAERLDLVAEESAQEVRGAAKASAGAHELAEAGSESAQDARNAMSAMAERIGSASEAVDELGADTADIGRIVATISAISAQTNLLALNAAIEAARAGEQGRGFAVVAEEVRVLAGESSDAADEISALIRGIEQTVQRTVRAVAEGRAEVARSVKVVDAAGDRFTEIAGSLEDIGQHVETIDSRSAVVSESTAAVRDAIERILEVTENLASLAQETSASTQEASASSEQITSSADSLRSTARDLEAQIAQFQI